MDDNANHNNIDHGDQRGIVSDTETTVGGRHGEMEEGGVGTTGRVKDTSESDRLQDQEQQQQQQQPHQEEEEEEEEEEGNVHDDMMLEGQDQPHHMLQQHQQQQQQVWQHVENNIPVGPAVLFLPSPHHQQHQLLQYYEAQMRDHATAYANAAAAAAMTAAQIAANISPANNHHNGNAAAPALPVPPQLFPPPPPMVMIPPTAEMGPMPFHPPRFSPHSQPNNVSMIPSPPSMYNQYGTNHHGFYVPRFDHSNDDSNSNSRPSDSHRNPKRQQRMAPSKNNNNGNNDHQWRRQQQQQQQQQQDDCQEERGEEGTYLPFDQFSPGAQPQQYHQHHYHHQQQHHQQQQLSRSQEKRGRRRRRFWNDVGSSDSDPSLNGGAHNVTTNTNIHVRVPNNRRRNRNMAKGASSSSDGGSASWTTKKKQRQQNDECLLGKTGAGALHEWCDKRRITPVFNVAVMREQTTTAGSGTGTALHHHQKRENETRAHEIKSPEKDPPWEQDDDSSQSNHSRQQHPEEEARTSRVKNIQWFQVTVIIDGVEAGTGCGASKAAAKQEASRHALQQLLPGVVFDEESGILVDLPATKTAVKRLNASAGSSQRTSSTAAAAATTTASCLEDLAPNLAKQLAIGHANDDDEEEDRGGSTGFRESKKRQKWLSDIYPGTSTTSDDEDDSTYLSSREAWACSSLLHAMVQIDDRLTEQPTYSYMVLARPYPNQGRLMNTKRKPGLPVQTMSTSFAKGSHQCTGVLKILVDNSDSSCPDALYCSSRPRESYQLLRAVGTGPSKRDARQNAAAKLLAMLFPECDGMTEVKQAAEAAREKYAASRALMRQHARRDWTFTTSNRFSDLSFAGGDKISSRVGFAVASNEMPPIPASIELAMASAIGCSHPNFEYLHGNSNVRIASGDDSGSIRQLSRQVQLEERVDNALQLLNEHDDEGRSLPEQLTVDDVGRTVLRRANAEDSLWIDKLFGSSKSSIRISMGLRPRSILSTDKGSVSQAHRSWSSSTIILLLCRAIAPHEDPPLGCAVLTVGFSMQKGKLLRVAEIASEPHLPRERFMECLLSFANCMACHLDSTSTLEPPYISLQKDFTGHILASNLPLLKKTFYEAKNQKTVIRRLSKPHQEEEALVEPSLQSVQEEEGDCLEESDSSLQQNRNKEKGQDKPSKRSRFE